MTDLPAATPALLRRLSESGLFDAAWYASAHPDVAASGMDPAVHFLRYGRLLRRAAGPGFDTAFCLDRYADLAAGGGNPLIQALDLAEDRPWTQADWQARIRALRRRAPRPGLVSVCLAARRDDRALRRTLASLEALGDRVEVILADATPGAVLAARMGARALPPADQTDPDRIDPARIETHLQGRAMGEVVLLPCPGQIVDGPWLDRLIALARAHPDGFLLIEAARADHPAGTSLALPPWLHDAGRRDGRRLGFGDDRWDLALDLLRRFPALPLIHTPASAPDRIPELARALASRPLANRTLCMADWPPLPAPHAAAAFDHAATRFDRALTAMAHVTDPTERQEVLHMLNRHKMAVIETIPPDLILPRIFAPAPPPPAIGPDDITLLACTRDEADFLAVLLPHYRRLGVTRFLIVDDGSDPPLQASALGSDVAVFRPACGDFRSAKTLWIETLMKRFLRPGAWVLTVDADEFLHLPRQWPSLAALTRDLDERGLDHVAGLLLDMAPDPDAAPAPTGSDPRAGLDRFLDDDATVDPAYAGDGAVRWGFGPDHAGLSWRFDLRWRLFGTVDSLRKIPLFRHRPHRHPNQGFHNFDCLDTSRQPGPEIWSQGPVLPILHYKLARLISADRRQAMLDRAEGYHARTRDNIARSFGGPGDGLSDRLRALAPQLRPADQAWRVTQAFARRA